MPFLLAEILNFQGSTHRIGVGSFSCLIHHVMFEFRNVHTPDATYLKYIECPDLKIQRNLFSLVFLVCLLYLYIIPLLAL